MGCWLLAWPRVMEKAALGTGPPPPRTFGIPLPVPLGVATHLRLTRFVAAGGPRPGEEIVLLVHSLVSDATILDLGPGRSLIGAMVDAGHDVVLLDWGAPGAPSATAGLVTHVDALRTVEVGLLHLGVRRIHLVGYCFGGTIAAARLARHPSDPWVASSVLVAAPIGPARRGMGRLIGSALLRPGFALDADGLVPALLVREAFHLLRFAAIKAAWASVRLGRAARSGEAPAELVAIARARASWTYDHRPLPGAAVFDLLRLARTDDLRRGLLGDLGRCRVPTLLVSAARDHIIDRTATAPLPLGGLVEDLVVPSGHVSMLEGKGGRDVLWPALSAWLDRWRVGPAGAAGPS